ncbi:hypothetical protein AB0K60_37155 [Thermopolyspora sp. NPDC052614]|uniref:hypothetical protein n=1 Tax=Thermopolyspora sp. NPDC052614 TaxID=3155682 RepID=UPI00343472C1
MRRDKERASPHLIAKKALLGSPADIHREAMRSRSQTGHNWFRAEHKIISGRLDPGIDHASASGGQ